MATQIFGDQKVYLFNMSMPLIVILGPTSSGKTALSIRLAKKFGGEIVSADSRQVYKGMDIGTGKVTKGEMRGIPHYLLDAASPKRKFTVVKYQKLAIGAINKILKRGKIPILCGGTGFYIQSVVDGIIIPEVKPDWPLRSRLEKNSAEKLFSLLKKLDPRRARDIDKHNRRRLIRSLEIAIKSKNPLPSLKKNPPPFDVLMIGIKKPPEELKKLIQQRLFKRLRQGMVAELRELRQQGVFWKRLDEFGLEYRFISAYLRGKLNYKEMAKLLQKAIEHYAKKQMTWFKKDKRIKWVKTYAGAEVLVKDFLQGRVGGEKP